MATKHVKGYGVQVTGIPELSRALKRTNVQFLREFQKELKDIAGDVIRKAESRGAPSGVLKKAGSMKGAGVSFPAGGPASGTDALGYYPWLDFGGGRVAGRGVTENYTLTFMGSLGETRRTRGHSGFRREVMKEGRYLYPAIGSMRDEIGDEVGKVIERAATREGFEVKG